MSWLILLLGLALWWVHTLKVFAKPRRDALGAQYGEGKVRAAMALLTVLSVVLIVIGFQSVPFIEVWSPPAFLIHVNNLLMVIGVVLFTAGNAPGNIKCFTRHPQLNGAKTWATAHLLVNGDLASILLFGSMLAWGVVAMIAINKRDGKGPLPAKGPWAPTLLHLVVALALFAAITFVHNLLGYWPFPH